MEVNIGLLVSDVPFETIGDIKVYKVGGEHPLSSVFLIIEDGELFVPFLVSSVDDLGDRLSVVRFSGEGVRCCHYRKSDKTLVEYIKGGGEKFSKFDASCDCGDRVTIYSDVGGKDECSHYSKKDDTLITYTRCSGKKVVVFENSADKGELIELVIRLSRSDCADFSKNDNTEIEVS